jgi:hypothetical protein
MQCGHRGFHTISSSYDRKTRVLTFFRRCDDCGARVAEAGRLAYEPRFAATRVERRVASRIIEPPFATSRGARLPHAVKGVFALQADCDYGAGLGVEMMEPTGRELTLSFDEFGWESLESQARRDGKTLDELLSRAAAYLDAELPTRRAAILVPPFKPRGRGTPREVRPELGRECWERLEGEAERQGVALERLLEHAALLYLADIDSGRVADRVLDRAEETGGDVQ